MTLRRRIHAYWRDFRPLWVLIIIVVQFYFLVRAIEGPKSMSMPDAALLSLLRNLSAVVATATGGRNDSVGLSVEPLPQPLGPSDNWKGSMTGEWTVFIYSAYYDDRVKPPTVRVFGIAQTKVVKKMSTIKCALRDAEGNLQISAAGKYLIPENWGLPYSAYRFDCEVKDELKPDKVSILDGGSSLRKDTGRELPPVTESVPIQYTAEDQLLGNFALCVKPFHFNYDRALWLVEFIEFYRLMGVDHFVFYNHTVGPNVQLVLENYRSENVVSVFPWSLPVKSQKEIRTEGLFTALNECIYRTSHRYRYTVVVDLDEFIVPRSHDNYTSMMAELDAPHKHSGTFVFQNAFFYLYWPNDTRASDYFQENGYEKRPYILTMFKTVRTKALHKVGIRSKYIVRPQDIIAAGNHITWKSLPGRVVQSVRPGVALSQHYRICEFGGFDCLKKPSEIDRAAQKYMTQLVPRIRSKCVEVFPGEDFCPEAPPLGSPW